MKKIRSLFCLSIDVIGFIDLAIIVISCFAQVIYRYIFGKSFFWVEELSIYLMIWLAFLGASKASALQENTRLSFIIKKLPHVLGTIVECISHLITIAFLYYLITYGFKLVGMLGSRYSVAVKIPMSFVYGALPVCGIFMMIFTILALAETIMTEFSKPNGKTEEDK